jgi:hypothetical protein
MMNIRKNLQCAVMAIVLLAGMVVLSQPVAAQQGGVTRYVYDQNGRLRAVISPNGEAAVYEYDPAGNFTAIRRLGANACEALEFSPRQGPFGTKVTIYGIGFKGEVSAVSFNGVEARIVSQTPASVIAEVPSGSTTGPISVTAPCGPPITLRPDFTVSGVMVLPEFIVVAPNRTVQFTASVAGLVDSAVRWSVEGVEGGSAATGIITDNGLYTAPPSAINANFTVRATSVVDSSLFGEARVKVTASGYEILARSVAVRYGMPADKVVAYVASPVAVRYGDPPRDRTAYVSGAVSVRYGDLPKNGLAYVTSPVSVTYGEPSRNNPVYISNSLSARFEPVPARGLVPVINSVSVTRGASISAFLINAVGIGKSATLTISGANLSAITAIQFINDDGAEETEIIAPTLEHQTDGTLLKAKVSISQRAKPGRRTICVMTVADGSPICVATGVIEVIP